MSHVYKVRAQFGTISTSRRPARTRPGFAINLCAFGSFSGCGLATCGGIGHVERSHADEIKKQYRIWAGPESLKLGMGRRSGVPALVVLNGETGQEMAFLPAEAQGAAAYQAWPLNDPDGIW